MSKLKISMWVLQFALANGSHSIWVGGDWRIVSLSWLAEFTWLHMIYGIHPINGVITLFVIVHNDMTAGAGLSIAGTLFLPIMYQCNHRFRSAY